MKGRVFRSTDPICVSMVLRVTNSDCAIWTLLMPFAAS